MPLEIKSFAQPRDLYDLPHADLNMIVGIRICAIAGKNGHDSLDLLAVRLNSVGAAKALYRLADTLGRLWPENFTISRPCCRRMTHDEGLVADLLAAVRCGDQGAFNGHIRDFIAPNFHGEIYRALALAASETDMAVIHAIPAGQ